MPAKPETPTKPVKPIEPEESDQGLVEEPSAEELLMQTIVLENIGTMSTMQMFALYLKSVKTDADLTIGDLDFNCDGSVDAKDLTQLLSSRGLSTVEWYYYNNLKLPMDERAILEDYMGGY